MTFLLILLALVLLLIILLFAVKSKVNLIFDSTSSDMHITVFWLYPLLKSIVTKEENGLLMTVYLFNKRILTRQIESRQKASGKESIIKSIHPTDIHVNTKYGFRDPFITGLACSAVTMVSQFFNVESLRQKPDFLAASDYFSLDATAKLNLGYSILKLM